MNPGFTLRAPAKINLGLEVLGRRPDGYHSLVTILHPIGLFDRLAFSPARELAVTVDGRPAVDANLIVRAALALREATGTSLGATIDAVKAIPAAAGLGGGSSDAATTLRGLCQLWSVSLPVARLHSLAASLGADVPFFLHGGAAVASGIGTELRPLPPLAGYSFVVLTPPVQVPANKTAALYHALGERDFSDGAATQAQAARLLAGAGLEPALVRNAFDGPCARLFPELDVWRERLRAAGAPWVALSGSGPTLVTALEDREAALAIAARLAAQGARCVVAGAGGADVAKR